MFELKKDDLNNKPLVGKWLLSFIKNDSFCRELHNEYMQEWAKKGLLQVFSKVFFRSEPETHNLISWFMDRLNMDLLLLKDSSREEFKNFIDKLSQYDMNFLEQIYVINEKYAIELRLLKSSFQECRAKITDKEDLSTFIFAFFADGILNSEIRVLSYCYDQWFGPAYKSESESNLMKKHELSLKVLRNPKLTKLIELAKNKHLALLKLAKTTE